MYFLWCHIYSLFQEQQQLYLILSNVIRHTLSHWQKAWFIDQQMGLLHLTAFNSLFIFVQILDSCRSNQRVPWKRALFWYADDSQQTSHPTWNPGVSPH